MAIVTTGGDYFTDIGGSLAIDGGEDFDVATINITEKDEANVEVRIIMDTPSPDTRIELGVGDRRQDATFYAPGDTITTPGTPAVPPTPPTGVTLGTLSQIFVAAAATGGITADDNNLYVLTRNTLRPYSRTSPYTAGATIDLPGTRIYSGIARDDNYFWLYAEGTNSVWRTDHNGRSQIQYTIDTPNSLRHVGMARVGDDQLLVCDGDTGMVHVYTIPETGTTLTRTANFASPLQSYGFWADDNFLYYSSYNGALRIHRRSDNVEVARGSAGAALVGITFRDGNLYFAGEGNRQIRTMPVTFTGATPGSPAVPGTERPAIPLQLGNLAVGDKRTLHIKRVVSANARRFTNDGYTLRVAARG